MTVLFWDIDGTLLTTARAGVFAWEEAVRELTEDRNTEDGFVAILGARSGDKDDAGQLAHAGAGRFRDGA